MNFFQSQDIARKKTRVLLVYFAGSVLLIIVLLYGFLQGAYVSSDKSHQNRAGEVYASQGDWQKFWNPYLLAGVAAGVLFNVTICSLYKFYELRSGGEAVAQMLGATPISRATRVTSERRLLN